MLKPGAPEPEMSAKTRSPGPEMSAKIRSHVPEIRRYGDQRSLNYTEEIHVPCVCSILQCSQATRVEEIISVT